MTEHPCQVNPEQVNSAAQFPVTGHKEPAAATIVREKLRRLLDHSQKTGKLDFSALMDVIGDLNLTSGQLDQLYDFLGVLNIDVSIDATLLTVQTDDGPTAMELARVDEEALADPSDLAECLAADDPVRRYLKEISKIPLLSESEEAELAQSMFAGAEAEARLAGETIRPEAGEELQLTRAELVQLKKDLFKGAYAQQKLAEANLRLVVSIARCYADSGVPFMDLIQEGNLGLIKATETFSRAANCKFSTYAAWWVRQFLTHGPAVHEYTLPVPHAIEAVNKIIHIRQQLAEKLGREPLSEEIAAEAGLPTDDVRQLLGVIQEPGQSHSRAYSSDSN